jgi:hypothetical protein
MDFVVFLPDCGWSVAYFWDWSAHEARLRCPEELDGDIWIWSTGRVLNLNSTNYTMVTMEIRPYKENIPMVEPGIEPGIWWPLDH